MDLSLQSFLHQIISNPALFITTILVLGVIFVNGWTDAPNAIATCVSTRSIGPRAAVIMAAIFNFIGVLVMTMVSRKVAEVIFDMADFSKVTTEAHNPAMIALCSALFGIVVWAVAAWVFGIPTSESHALIAGISGAAIAMGGIGGINGNEWMKVIFGLILSTFLGFGLGYVILKLIEFIFRPFSLKKTENGFKWGQIAGGAMMAFMHGAQDGQKFIGVFVLGMFIANNQEQTAFTIPFWLIVLVSLVMGVGTSIGGYRIIKAVGMDMVKLKKYQGFAADLAASICLLISTL
ncbi:MAG: inorganic phosphate transporter, partial [Clostridiales bacterium]|nr:inorganic phosphate transporter [Clostridiales bacterium]